MEEIFGLLGDWGWFGERGLDEEQLLELFEEICKLVDAFDALLEGLGSAELELGLMHMNEAWEME